MWEVHAIKITCASHIPRDIYQSYMWVVWNFLQTAVQEEKKKKKEKEKSRVTHN